LGRSSTVDPADDREVAKLQIDFDSGQSATAGLEIGEPGEYVYSCSVPGHASAGMHGTLTVIAPDLPAGGEHTSDGMPMGDDARGGRHASGNRDEHDRRASTPIDGVRVIEVSTTEVASPPQGSPKVHPDGTVAHGYRRPAAR
jgi:hypothetical protein